MKLTLVQMTMIFSLIISCLSLRIIMCSKGRSARSWWCKHPQALHEVESDFENLCRQHSQMLERSESWRNSGEGRSWNPSKAMKLPCLHSRGASIQYIILGVRTGHVVSQAAILSSGECFEQDRQRMIAAWMWSVGVPRPEMLNSERRLLHPLLRSWWMLVNAW